MTDSGPPGIIYSTAIKCRKCGAPSMFPCTDERGIFGWPHEERALDDRWATRYGCCPVCQKRRRVVHQRGTLNHPEMTVDFSTWSNGPFCMAQVEPGEESFLYRQCGRKPGYGPQKSFCEKHAEEIAND